jgi:hypothetical protein
LSGFGQWVNDILGHEGELKDGVQVIHRDDDNYYEVASTICGAIKAMTVMPKTERNNIRKKAATIADKAQWKHFIKYYFEAYAFALKNVEG